MRRRRWRSVVLWGGCTLSVLIAVAFVVSAWWLVVIDGGDVVAAVVRGFLTVQYYELPNSSLVQRHSFQLRGWNDWGFGMWWFKVPLYALFLAVAVPTLLVWRFVPKFPRGHCVRCGYNLTGLTETRCPECGAEFGRDTFEAERCR